MYSVKYNFDYSEAKSLILREVRGVDFKDIIRAINKGHIVDNIDHFNKKKYPHQKIFIVKVKDKVYAVPYVIDKERKMTFLKTIYPSRTLKKKYLK